MTVQTPPVQNAQSGLVTRRALTFLLVGGLSSTGYLVTMSASVELLHLHVLGAAFLAFCVGTAISYVGNSLLTFQAPMTRATLVKFLMVVAVGMALNQLIVFLLDAAGLHYVLISIVVFVSIPIFNFIGHSLFTYKH